MRIAPLDLAEAPADARRAAADHAAYVGRITNMKRTLLHSLPAFHALMTWYDLRDTVRAFLGDRLTTLFAHAVSTETDCLICSTFFRRLLVESGENPDHLMLSDEDSAVVAFGRALAVTPYRVSDTVFDPLRARYTDAQLVALTAFGALMVATNVVNNALDVPLDGYLEPYRREAAPDDAREAAHGRT
jgi:alkylhydroperoxidase family enzyme